MLVPSKVDLADFMSPIIESVKVLQNQGVVVYDATRGEYKLVYAALALIVADMPQACELCGTVGPNGNLSCRTCTCSFETRLVWEDDFISYLTQRRKQQTTAIVAQMKSENELTHASFEAIRTKYGVQFREQEIFQDVDFDCHLQCPPEPDHLFVLGIIKNVVEHCQQNVDFTKEVTWTKIEQLTGRGSRHSLLYCWWCSSTTLNERNNVTIFCSNCYSYRSHKSGQTLLSS